MGLIMRFAQTTFDFGRGKHFGRLGAPQSMNPHRYAAPRGRTRWQNWLRGWQAGRAERLETRQKGGV